MNSKEELVELLEQLPEEKIPQAIILLKELIEKQHGDMIIPSALDSFMAVIVHSITNTMYDLSMDARRKEEKVMANRLETYRKKVSEGWEIYKGRKEISKES